MTEPAMPAAAPPSGDQADPFRQELLQALALADAFACALVTSECQYTVDARGTRWFDTGPLLDLREYGGPSCDLHAHALAHGIGRRLMQRHPDAQRNAACAHLVRLLPAIPQPAWIDPRR